MYTDLLSIPPFNFLLLSILIATANSQGSWTSWYGGDTGGTGFLSPTDNSAILTQVCCRNGDEIDNIKAYFSDGTNSATYGGSGGDSLECTTQLNAGACFTKVKLRIEIFESGTYMDTLQFISSDGVNSNIFGISNGNTLHTLSGSTNQCLTKINVQTDAWVRRMRFYFDTTPAPTKVPTTTPTPSPTDPTSKPTYTPIATFSSTIQPSYISNPPTLSPTTSPSLSPTSKMIEIGSGEALDDEQLLDVTTTITLPIDKLIDGGTTSTVDWVIILVIVLSVMVVLCGVYIVYDKWYKNRKFDVEMVSSDDQGGGGGDLQRVMSETLNDDIICTVYNNSSNFGDVDDGDIVTVINATDIGHKEADENVIDGNVTDTDMDVDNLEVNVGEESVSNDGIIGNTIKVE